MDFFGMGMGEILLILVLALIIWGPGKIPEIARTLGKVVGTLRKASFDLTAQMRKEIDMEEKDSPSRPVASSSAKTGKSSDEVAAEPTKNEETSQKD